RGGTALYQRVFRVLRPLGRRRAVPAVLRHISGGGRSSGRRTHGRDRGPPVKGPLGFLTQVASLLSQTAPSLVAWCRREPRYQAPRSRRPAKHATTTLNRQPLR